MKLVYLDTCQLRNLAEGLGDSAWARIDNLIKNGSFRLVISFFHLYDFTQKQNIMKDTIVEYLDTLNEIVWVISPYSCRSLSRYRGVVRRRTRH